MPFPNFFETRIGVGVFDSIIRFNKAFCYGFIAYFSLKWSWFSY